MSTSNIEHLLWQKICEGDVNAFNFFFKSKYKPLCAAAFILLKNEALVEDVVQECFIKLWERKQDLKHISNIEAYLFVTVKNTCLDKLRKQKPVEDISGIKEIGIQENPFDLLYIRELGEKLDSAVAQLPVKCKEIFEKVYIEGEKYQEVANTMGISINTVKTQLKRAVFRLRIVLKRNR